MLPLAYIDRSKTKYSQMDAYTYLHLCISLFFPLLLFLILLFIKRYKRSNKLNHPPSPPKLPIIGHMHLLRNLPHHSLWNLSKQYGPIMLLQFGRMPTIVVSSAETASEVMKTNDTDLCSRPSLVGTKRLSYNFRDMAFGPYSEYWREMRRICNLELFSLKRVHSFRYVREEEVAKWINSISESTPVNLTEKLFSITDHITCRIAFGLNDQGRESDIAMFHELVNEATDMLSMFAATDFFPYFGWIIDVFTGHSSRLEKCFTALDTFYQKLIDEHLDSERTKPEQRDIIDVLTELRMDQSGLTRLPISHIKGVLMNLFIGGVDTSSIILTWAMAELVRKPEKMKRVQDEIRTCVGKKGKVEESDINQLQYLKMVVKETFRLHPPVPLLIPRESINHCKINGYDISPKTRVLVNVWAIGRSSKYWQNPEDFFPERFMNSSIDFRGQDFEFLPFGSGRRACPGLNMGIAAIELALANLLYSFNWELPSGIMKEDINMDEISDLIVRMKFPLHLIPIKHNWQ